MSGDELWERIQRGDFTAFAEIERWGLGRAAALRLLGVNPERQFPRIPILLLDRNVTPAVGSVVWLSLTWIAGGSGK